VYRGRVPGVYATWDRCNAQVTGFKNNSYKSFPNKEEAEASYLEFMGCEDDKVFVKPPPKVVRNTPVLFVVAVVQSFFFAGALVVRSCSLLQVHVMLKMCRANL